MEREPDLKGGSDDSDDILISGVYDNDCDRMAFPTTFWCVLGKHVQSQINERASFLIGVGWFFLDKRVRSEIIKTSCKRFRIGVNYTPLCRTDSF